jgi:cold shock CspA family protein
MKGVVKNYNPIKKRGLIEEEDGTEVVFHQNSIPMGIRLNEGDKVEYHIVDSEMGALARSIKKIVEGEKI